MARRLRRFEGDWVFRDSRSARIDAAERPDPGPRERRHRLAQPDLDPAHVQGELARLANVPARAVMRQRELARPPTVISRYGSSPR